MKKTPASSEAFGKAQLLVIMSVACLSLLVTLTVYAPNLIYFSQREYFGNYFLALIMQPFLYGLAAVLVLLAFFSVWPKFLLKYIVSLMLMLAILLWLQVDYFAVSYGVLDGADLNFEHFNSRGFIELVVLSLTFVLAIVFNRLVIKNVSFVVLLVLLGQLALVTTNMIQEPNDKDKITEVDDEFHRYSTDKNVLLIILDTFGAEYFQTIIKSNPDVLDEYPGFVSYTDAISNYPATYGSLPSMLTGQMIPESVKFNRFAKDTLQPDGLPQKFDENGYSVSVISTTNWLADAYPERYMSELMIDQKVMNQYHSFQLFDYALFRAAIHWFKPMIFDDGQWFLSKQISANTAIPNTPAERGFALIDSLTNEAELGGQQPRFKLLHLTIPHPEYVYDKDCVINSEVPDWPVQRRMLEQSECALSQLNHLLDKYKSLGVYDNSLIVVTSDHGARVFDDHHINGFPSQFELNSSGILFMVKGVNQTLPFKQVSQPFSLLKLAPNLLDSQLHETDYSMMKDDYRLFYAYQNWHASAKGYLPDAPMYQVGPKYDDISSWSLLGFKVNNCLPENLPLTMKFQNAEREGYCSTFGFDRPRGSGEGTRTLGSDSRIIFNLNPKTIQANKKYMIKMDFESMLDSGQPMQELSIYLNDQLIGLQSIEGTNSYLLEAGFSADLLMSEKNVLQIRLPGVVSMNELGLGGSSLRLGIMLRSLSINE